MITRWRNKQKRKEEIERLLKPSNIVTVIDTETTGLNEDAKIIQFSAIKYEITDEHKLRRIDDMDIYINPKEKLSNKIIEITGITDRILSVAKSENVWVERIFKFLEESTVIAGYNVLFDVKMLKQMAQRTKVKYNERPYIDVMEMARDWVLKEQSARHNLQTILEYFHAGENFQFHSAFEDVKATAMLLQDFIGMYKNYSNEEQEKKDLVHLEKASLFINPRKRSEQRIKLLLSVGEFGDIFWDIKNQEWGCCKKTSAKNYFNTINLTDLEEQFMNKYGYKFGCNLPKDVAKTWMEYKNQKKN